MNETASPKGSPSPGRVGVNGLSPQVVMLQLARHGKTRKDAMQVTKRNPWSEKKNVLVVECYIRSDPSRRGCRERIIKKWTIQGGELISECLPTNILQ